MKHTNAVKALNKRQAAYDALRPEDKQGRKRPGNIKR